MRRVGMKWQISDVWGIGIDEYNWILYRRYKKTWRAVSFYPTPEKLLYSLFQELARTHGPESDIVRQVEKAHRLTVACIKRVSEHIQAELGPLKNMTPMQAVVAKKAVASKMQGG